MEFEAIIGLEIHAQLLTKSKMFCSCSADYAGAPPNTHVCPVCLGMPGTLPVINRKAVEYAIMAALALNCEISEYVKFDRKNYPYPDLMKGYQISQYDMPLSRNGWLEIEAQGKRKRIGIIRVHLEEDVAKLKHVTTPEGESYTLIDVNRSGVPLLEIVTKPDLRTPEEARAFLMKLRTILRYLGISSGNMEEGSLRCDANVSVRPLGSDIMPPKVEIKNMNSFKAVYQALEYEINRQIEILKGGGELVQETRGWVEDKGITVPQRTKEYAHDYRYFPEPDLPPLHISREWVEEIRSRLPELPDARRDRFVEQYKLPEYDAGILANSKPLADYFEACLALMEPTPENAKTISNWLLGEFARLLNLAGLEIDQAKVKPEQLVELVRKVERGELTLTLAKRVFEKMFESGRSASEVMAEEGLGVMAGEELKPLVKRVIEENPKAVADYKKGKKQALQFLLGQVMRLTRGQADPQITAALLREELGE